jgi:hypothetical protein
VTDRIAIVGRMTAIGNRIAERVRTVGRLVEDQPLGITDQRRESATTAAVSAVFMVCCPSPWRRHAANGSDSGA